MNISNKDKKECCGCSACANICAHNAISMQPDEFGFYYPIVNNDKCTNCGVCVQICQFNSSYRRYDNFKYPLVYGARHKNIRELDNSQSGAISWAFIEQFFENDNRAVYGVAFESVTHIVHRRADIIEDARAFRGSKYVQSDITGIYANIKQDLISNIEVLFFGTPCQVAGLKSYIPRKLHSGLTTVDIICNAVPSPEVWKLYVHYLENKYNAKITSANFRSKKFGWKSPTETFELNNGESEINTTTFRCLFYDHIITRQSCANCPYTNLNRVSDITIGDFWGWEKNHAEWADNKGVSLVLVNSDKGKAFYKESLIRIDSIESNAIECMQPQLQNPSTTDYHITDRAEAVLIEKGFTHFLKRYSNIGLQYKINKIRRRIKNKILRIIRK